MFNFHKPRTYRSTEGCCICRAKSSSSRFMDSRKYEWDIVMQCFDLKYPRQGEICNACVLLVKRFKRLPDGSKRNWSHIVDAKAGIGPGYNKIHTKYKSERISSKAAAQQQQENVSDSLSANNSNISTGNGTGSNALNNMFFIPEKFSKIFKKSKNRKETSHNSKRKLGNNGWSQNNHSLPTTPDSLDSDYEDTRLSASLSGNPGSTVVQFQTQTRASAYKAQAAAEARKKIIKLGTKRRKCLPPRKHYRVIKYEESLQFFDDEEWQERKSCCGMFYECATLGGALLIDTSNYKPCEQHQRRRLTCQEEDKPEVLAANVKKNTTALPLPKSIIQTMPAVVQLQPLHGPSSSPVLSTLHSYNSNSTNNSFKTAMTTTTTATATPVLKKHHLFFKRQSECFPQGDNIINDTNSTPPLLANIIKTESEQHQNQLHYDQKQQHQHQQHQQQQSSTTLQRHIENAIHSSTLANPPNTILTNSLASLALSISVTSSSPSTASSSVTVSTLPQMPKHSLAKVTTISPPLTTSIQNSYHHHNANSNSTLPLAKPNSFVHKIKTDSGKIAKHSLEKLNTAVRLKTSDINEMKPIIRTVDKSYIIAKPPTQANIVSLNATNTATTTYQSLASYNAAAQSPLTTASLSAASPTSSTSSTSSTKFSDNSSDSGFDENMLDRKSASPLQEDFEKKILSRPGVQTMFLASGVQIQGQPQNLILTGNEVAAKILQNRKYSTLATNSRSLTSNHHPTTTAVKITQISTAPLTSSTSSAVSSVGQPMPMSSAAQAKMRAIYNNNNTIQHENGITTIVPASSLAASTQTAAMQNIAPSTVTITPAPPVGTQFNQQNVISRKLTTANIINLQSNTTNLSNSYNNTSGNHHYNHHLSCNSSGISSSSSSNSSSNNHSNTANQKIILLKTSPKNTTTTSANYNAVATGGGHHGSSGLGGR